MGNMFRGKHGTGFLFNLKESDDITIRSKKGTVVTIPLDDMVEMVGYSLPEMADMLNGKYRLDPNGYRYIIFGNKKIEKGVEVTTVTKVRFHDRDTRRITEKFPDFDLGKLKPKALKHAFRKMCRNFGRKVKH